MIISHSGQKMTEQSNRAEAGSLINVKGKVEGAWLNPPFSCRADFRKCNEIAFIPARYLHGNLRRAPVPQVAPVS